MNINNNTNNSLSFGWYKTIHKNITKKSGKKLGLNSDLVKKLAYYAKRPDKDEIFIFREKHYFYPAKNKSFLDFTKTRNAKSVYKKHLEKMQDAFFAGNREKVIDEAGRALHYLQDMSQPHHIEEGSVFKKIKTAIVPHIAFEKQIDKLQNELYGKAEHINIDADNFDELFQNTIKLTQKIDVPKKNNRDNWANIGQKAINITISSTDKFFKLIEKYLK